MTITRVEVPDEVRHRVGQGALLLDHRYGSTWFTKIDILTLDIGSCFKCILGQLFGEYDLALRRLNSEDLEEGFDPPDMGFDKDTYNLWLIAERQPARLVELSGLEQQQLETAWIDEILKRASD